MPETEFTWKDLSSLLDSHDYAQALELASAKAFSAPDLCKHSSDFLAVASRACAANRQWAMAQLLSLRALSVNSFSDTQLEQTAISMFAFTAGCDLVLRVIPEAPSRLRPQLIETISDVLSWFDDTGNLDCRDSEYREQWKLHFILLITGYCDFPANIKRTLLSHLQALRDIHPPSAVHSRVRKLTLTTESDWVLQVDASEIGNEARYANHADFPNGILLKRPSHGRNLPHIVALRTIHEGDEITINYGSSYWSRVRPGTDPLLLGQIITHPFTDCIYFDGVVEDFTCSSAPGGFLIPPTDHEKRIRRTSSLQVKQVAREHPAFPGFGLFSNQTFNKGDIICIYGGIIDHSPHSGRHASKYAVDLTSDPGIGPFGFYFDPSSLAVLPRQRFLPFLTDFPDISTSQSDCEENLLAGIVSVADLNEQVSHSICRAICDPKFRATMVKKLREIKPPFENPTKKDMQNWKRIAQKTFSDTFTKPPLESDSTLGLLKKNDPELQIVLEN